jgi:co-chaperonin GroES (HSP10)
MFDRDVIKRVVAANPFEPRNDAVIVFRVKLDQTAGGILLPDVQNHKASMGFATCAVVVSAGPGRYIELTGGREPLDINPGDLVLFTAQAGLELGEIVRRELGSDLAFEEIRLIRAHDIIVKLKDRNILEQELESERLRERDSLIQELESRHVASEH